MADTRSFEERQRDLIGVEQNARLVGVEQIERWDRIESELYRTRRALQEFIDAGRQLVGYDPAYGWYAVSDEHGDNLREYLIPLMEKYANA
jgi:hypothetical protein